MKHWLTRLNPLGCCLLILFAAGAALAQAGKSSTAKPPNYLFIAIDDLNDCPLGSHPQVKTSHIDRLAARGALLPMPTRLIFITAETRKASGKML
jgi:hypothetical protein